MSRAAPRTWRDNLRFEKKSVLIVPTMNTPQKETYPMRINKYLAHKNYCTRREADTLIEQGKVLINGKPAQLGDKVKETDKVDVRFRAKKHRYFAYHKPRGIITHSPEEDETDIRQSIPLVGVFPVGRLDKDSSGLIILTDDGRITDKLLNPDYEHEKEYVVSTREELPNNFKTKVEPGINIEGYMTKPAVVKVLSPKKFTITITEGKKHQIRRMVAFFGLATSSLQRTRIENIHLSGLKPGEYRELKGPELATFLKSLGF
jgi:23S rRNA pseudouridine2604 synthase